MQKLYTLVLSMALFSTTFGQTPKPWDSGEIYAAIQKLNFLGSVLYVAAHPDDENTALISYFSNAVHARTAYLAMTRGDGGQNLIGPELRELLGVIRTEELLAARRIDGGQQFFSRANDFGYSKTPKETFKFWDKQKVLSDLVYVIRKFKPDIIINRFDARTPGTTHGHHTASAILSVEAFDLAGDKTKFPQQLKYVTPWQPQRLFFNDSWFFYENKEAFKNADHHKDFAIDIEKYYPLLGMSNSEIAAKSRSQHRSQGFGAAPDRGKSIEYLEPLKGSEIQNSVFDGIDTTWNRIKGGKDLGKILYQVQDNFDFKNPAASVPQLMKAYQLIQQLENPHWKRVKSEEIKKIILAASGLYLEASAQSATAVAGENVKIHVEALNRSSLPITLNSISINGKKVAFTSNLAKKKDVKFEYDFKIPTNQQPTNPYWLNEEIGIGMYQVSDPKLIGLPETPAPFEVTYELSLAGERLSITQPLVYRYVDRSKGEIIQPFIVVPKASVGIENKVILFSDAQPKTITVKVKSFTPKLSGSLSLQAPKDWKIEPESIQVNLAAKNEFKRYTFQVTPPGNRAEAKLVPNLKIGDKTLSKQVYEIDYEHIPNQKITLPGEAKIVRLNLKRKGNKIGYVEGAGDSVAENLRQIGYEVKIIEPEEITEEKLANFDAVVLGIRAFNVVPELIYKNQILFNYAKNGGNLIVQYNVTRGHLLTKEIAPFPLQLSDERVTDEHSEVKFINPDNPVLNIPNKITQQDFEGWVQERGLYFPIKWSDNFTPILSMHDPDEAPLKGSLLVAKYGKGYYVYTGLSFFRELPAGVSGAYKLFANLLSLGK